VTPVEIETSRRKYIIGLLAALGFLMVGVVMLVAGRPEYPGLAWLIVVIFGLGALNFAAYIFASRPRILINDEGVLDGTLGVGVIPWSDIADAHVKQIAGNNFICLELRDEQKWLSRLNSLRRAMTSANKAPGFTALNVNLSGLDVDATEVHEVIMRMIDANSPGLAGR
jgi:hypothetical protein